MKRKNATRSALFTSIISLLLCVSMLVGTTFAWFTDEVTSGMNVIAAGNLDIELEYSKDGLSWATVEDASELFSNELWEPGHTEVVYLRMSNLGTLALKYQLGINVSETTGTNVANETFKLSDYIYMGVVEAEPSYTTREAAIEAAKSGANGIIGEGYSSNGTMLAGQEALNLAVVVYMPETVGNEANYKTGTTAPVINLGIKLSAIQQMEEEDSFGPDYDEAAKFVTPVATLNDFFDAVEAGNNVLLQDTIAVNQALIDYMLERYPSTYTSVVNGTIADIDGNGITVYRTEEMKEKPMFLVTGGYGLTLSNITVDGGAVWSGETDPTLLRGTVNTGMTTSKALVEATGNGVVVLNAGTVLQNNDGANAVYLATRGGGSLTLTGAQVINNRSAAGAIWGGDDITINAGSKINGNHATNIGGAIRMVNGNNAITFTMNGGEINHNHSDGTGGAIWGGNNATYKFNDGEMAYNTAASAGGAIWTGTYEKYFISGTFELHDNSGGELAGAIRFCDHSSLTMTGGKVYNNTVNGVSNAFYLNNNTATITGGTISDNFSYSGGLGLTLGEANIESVIHYNLATNHKTAYLDASFASFKFTVEESHVANFNFKPAAGYTYTEGDEAKLICMNEGYETYWDTATGTFRLRAE